MINIQCPSCKHRLQIDEKYAGTSGRCTHCQAMINVPKMAQPEPQRKPTQKEPKQYSPLQWGFGIGCGCVLVPLTIMVFGWILSAILLGIEHAGTQ